MESASADHAESGRPWPKPRGPWIMRQVWSDLLFAHWRVEPERLAPLIPPGLELDTRDGAAWLGIVPFDIPASQTRAGLSVPFARRFLELNVRTYVRPPGGDPGVWFFSLDAESWPAVIGARVGFGLPYFHARMSLARGEDGWIEYASRRLNPAAHGATFQARYRPVGPAFEARPGSLEEFLCERYCLYARRGKWLFRSDIDHPKWRLRPAEAEVQVNQMARWLGVELEGAPLPHFAEPQDTKIWPIRRVKAT